MTNGAGANQPNPCVPTSISSLPHQVPTGCSFNLILSSGVQQAEHAVVSCGWAAAVFYASFHDFHGPLLQYSENDLGQPGGGHGPGWPS
jgi:hypothetical protein